MENDKLIEETLKKEGGLVNNPKDKGGITKFGITKPTLAWFRNVPVSTITDEDIKNLVVDDAKAIYNAKFVNGPGFDKIPESVLKSNLVDFGIMSGPTLAILNLQAILQVESDGKIGSKTLTALSNTSLEKVNCELVKKRALMAVRICVKDPSQLAFLNGWLQRILSFL